MISISCIVNILYLYYYFYGFSTDGIIKIINENNLFYPCSIAIFYILSIIALEIYSKCGSPLEIIKELIKIILNNYISS